jgi:hypothetical protein
MVGEPANAGVAGIANASRPIAALAAMAKIFRDGRMCMNCPLLDQSHHKECREWQS